MLESLSGPTGQLLGAVDLAAWWANIEAFIKVLIGFSIIIVVHELGHFLFAKWSGVRVERFAVGFGPRLFGYRPGEGFTWGSSRDLKPDELRERGWSETDYCFRALPLGGYVKMLGQDDIIIDDKTGEVSMTDDPRAFTNRPVGQRMLIVSAGVVFNVLFAALLFMWVFLIGHNMPAPVIGYVAPLSPAEEAGVQAGDRVLAINGRRVDSYVDVVQSEALYDELRLRVERDGRELPEELVVHSEWDRDRRARVAGIDPARTTKMLVEGVPLVGREAPQVGDKVIAVAGHPINGPLDVELAFRMSRGAVLDLTVERLDPEHPNAEPRVVETYQRPAISVMPADPSQTKRENIHDHLHILGLQQRMMVNAMSDASPAREAGFEVGDVIVEWDRIANPLYSEIIASISDHDGEPIDVLVDRVGAAEPVQVTVTPRGKFSLFREAPPKVGIAFRGETRTPIVANYVPGTPAAELLLPRGARLTKIGERAIANWYDIVNGLKDLAGQRVAVEYSAAGEIARGSLTIPGSVVDAINLPPDASVLLVRTVDASGDDAEADEEVHWNTPIIAPPKLRELLKERIGKTVELVYTRLGQPGQRYVSEPFAVTENNFDPWQARIAFRFDRWDGIFETQMERVHAHGNPLRATWMGAKLTYYQVMMVYRTLRQMLQARVSVENVSGPIGIFEIAIDRAKVGFADLLFILALLSLNLAVLNFLPLPVVDGGVMVFLIIEKIKGSPLSLKTQMISTLVGLGLILICFVLVTFQDLMRIFVP